MEKRTISYDRFLEILNISNYMTCEEIKEMHKCLIGVYDSSKIHNGDFGDYYIYRILEYGDSSFKETPSGYKKFFNSVYLSNYVKELINRIIKCQPTIIKNALASERNFSEFTEEEFYEIFKIAQNTYTTASSMLCNLIVSYALRLNSVGAKNFLNNRIDHTILIKKIVLASGLNSKSEYYCGRGVNLRDLNSEHIMSIYKKLARIDERKALNMLKMTFNMPILGVTEFLESLYNLVDNDYEFDESIISYNNHSLGNSRGRGREMTTISLFPASLFSTQRSLTNTIKKELKEKLPKDIIEKINSKEYDSDLKCDGYSRKRNR